ncbi:MAG: DapH/DapD/GlmU-related protein [Kiritimatiellia bacterium]|jgi:acetyltransferase-like isoleucine patch superfamily enzyme|nr:DapH/DapD/GlmU-related protein [Kiritimatiellia bacterium]
MKRMLKKILYSGLPVPEVIRPVIGLGYRVGVVAVESLAFLKKLLWVEPVLRSVCEQVGKGLRAERLPYMRGEGAITLGDRVNLSGRSCFYFISGMPEKPSIEIGNGVFIGNGCTLSAAKGIVIGDCCLLSAEVRVHDNDGHPLDPGKRRTNLPMTPEDASPVKIEDNVWIGARATILKGVTLGCNSVIGTGAVVTKDVPSNTIVAGNPARQVGELSDDEKDESYDKM